MLEGRQEDDRDVARAVALANQVRDLEPVHARHLDVHQDEREVVGQQPPQGLNARAGTNEVLAQLLESDFQDGEVAGCVIDHENVNFGLLLHRLFSYGRVTSPGLALAVKPDAQQRS